MQPFAQQQSVGRAIAHTLWFVAVALTGLATAFYSQATSSNYQHLFWVILPIGFLHWILARRYFGRTLERTRWIALGIECMAVGSFAELTLRVWLD